MALSARQARLPARRNRSTPKKGPSRRGDDRHGVARRRSRADVQRPESTRKRFRPGPDRSVPSVVSRWIKATVVADLVRCEVGINGGATSAWLSGNWALAPSSGVIRTLRANSLATAPGGRQHDVDACHRGTGLVSCPMDRLGKASSASLRATGAIGWSTWLHVAFGPTGRTRTGRGISKPPRALDLARPSSRQRRRSRSNAMTTRPACGRPAASLMVPRTTKSVLAVERAELFEQRVEDLCRGVVDLAAETVAQTLLDLQKQDQLAGRIAEGLYGLLVAQLRRVLSVHRRREIAAERRLRLFQKGKMSAARRLTTFVALGGEAGLGID